jgi:hypothetical protein
MRDFLNHDVVDSMTASEIQDLTTSDMQHIFAEDGASFLMAEPNDTTKNVDPFGFNVLYPCKVARASEDGKRLVLPFGFWSSDMRYNRSLYIRDAYKDHWDIIRHRVLEEKCFGTIFINGTCGAGKTVEGFFILNQIFKSLGSGSPPIIYANTSGYTDFFVHFRGLYFRGTDYRRFMNSSSYRMMHKTSAEIWHICDSGSGPLIPSWADWGPQIVITSPPSERVDYKAYKNFCPDTLYLPLPTLSEMESIRDAIFAGRTTGEYFISQEKMDELIDKYGCNPRTVLNFRSRKNMLQKIDEQIKYAPCDDLWYALRITTSWEGNDVVRSGHTIQITPYHKPKASREYNWGGDAPSRKAVVNKLKQEYMRFDHKWASTSIRDHAFECLLNFDHDRLKQLIRDYKFSSFSAGSGLLLQPFVHKLLTETGVRGRFRSLETEEKSGKIKLGPWRTKVYRNHSEIDVSANICNVPHTGVATEFSAIVPSCGLVIAIAGHINRGLDGTEFENLFRAGVFRQFRAKCPGKAVRMIWIVEAQSYHDFRKQEFQDKEKYEMDLDLPSPFIDVQQIAVEMDLMRICEFRNAQKRGNLMDMTTKRRWKHICKSTRSWVENVDDCIRWQFYRLRGVIGV